MSTNASPPRSAALHIVERLRDAGFVAYFAGGCVRDELLGREPSDYDIATDATPTQITRVFEHTAEVGAHFGVVLVRIDRQVVEVATFRSDGIYSDARRPDSVQFSSPLLDAQRRDFTVNALFFAPGTVTIAHADARTKPFADGIVIDFVNGLDDLSRRVLRAVGDPHLRLAEDHLRSLRAVRLAAKLDFAIDPATADAIRAHATDLRGISRERVGDELRAMLTIDAPAQRAQSMRARAAQLLCDLALEVPVFQDAIAPPHPTSHDPANLLASLPQSTPFAVSLCAWLIARGLSPLDTAAGILAASRLRAALALSNEERATFLAALSGVATSNAWHSLTVAQKKRFLAGPSAVGVPLAGILNPPSREAVSRSARELADDGIGLAPQPLLTGDILVSWGHKPGPKFKALLDRVYDAQLEGRIKNLTAARELVDALSV